MLTVRVEHDFSDATSLRNTSRYGRSEQERVLTAPQPGAEPRGRVGSEHLDGRPQSSGELSVRTRSSPTRRTSTPASTRAASSTTWRRASSSSTRSSSPRRWAASARSRRPTSTTRTASACSPCAPNIAPTGAYSDGNTVTSALYAFDTWKLTPQVGTDHRPAFRALQHRDGCCVGHRGDRHRSVP